MTNTFQPAPNPSIAQAQSAPPPERAHVLVIGNEKGGSGKSTTALHIAVALLNDGAKVATLDLDARQGTLGRYVENRAAYAKRKAVDLPMPVHAAVPLSELLEPATYREETWDLWGAPRPMAFYELPGETVWGATARILTRLLTLVTGVVQEPEWDEHRPLG